MRKLSFIGLAVACSSLIVASACSDNTTVTPSDAGTDTSTTPDTSTASDAPTTSPSTCTDADLCFDVEPARPGTTPLPGRLVVVWHQVNDDGPDPSPKIAYEVPFTGTEKRIAIPIDRIALPDEQNLYCHRDCTDEATCPCLADPKAGIGLIYVLSEGDAAVKEAIGFARMAVAYSDKAYKPAPPAQDRVYAPNDVLFPDGIEQGVKGYSLVRPDGGGFDRLGIPAAGTVFKLQVCDTTDTAICEPDGPNLS